MVFTGLLLGTGGRVVRILFQDWLHDSAWFNKGVAYQRYFVTSLQTIGNNPVAANAGAGFNRGRFQFRTVVNNKRHKDALHLVDSFLWNQSGIWNFLRFEPNFNILTGPK